MSITDAATELAQLGSMIRRADKAKGQNVLNGFAVCLGVKATEAIYFELLAAVRSRIEDLASFARAVEDPELTEGLRKSVLQATGSFASLFDPTQLVLTWDSTRASTVTDVHINSLSWFGQTVRRHRPLQLVEANDRADLLSKIDSLLSDVELDTSLGWKRAPLVLGLKRLQLIIKHLECFGHEAAIHELFNFHQRLVALNEADDATSKGQGGNTSILAILTVINLAASLFVMPDQTATAVSRYERFIIQAISSNTTGPSKPRLLPPPTALSPSAPREEASSR